MSIDPRLMERRKTVAEDNAKKSISRLLKFLTVIVLAGASAWLLFSPWLSVVKWTPVGSAPARRTPYSPRAGFGPVLR
jgi:hypothetical protein